MTDVSILHYRTVEGRFPYREWLESITDKTARAAVLARVDRLAFGTFGDWKPAGEGVCELRVHVGAGYRVYFGPGREYGGDPALRRNQTLAGRRHQTGEEVLERL